jgi:hypothetical protein
MTSCRLTDAIVVFGLRLKREPSPVLFRRIRAVKQLRTYQYILRQGELKGARNVLLIVGKAKFGPPARRVKATIQQLENLSRLRRMTLHVLNATSWDDVLATH